MLLYIGVAVWPLIIQYLYKNKPLHHNIKPYLFIASLPIFILLAFRGAYMGADTSGYLHHFANLINAPLENAIQNSRMEAGYIIFAKLITYITHNPLIYQVICVLIMYIGIFEFMKQLENDDAFLFLFFYCTLGLFFFMFTGTRQCLAMSICLFSYKYIRRKKYIRLLLCIALAFNFHKSSILFLIIPFIYKKSVSILNTVLYGVIVLITSNYLELVQDWFNEQLDYSYKIEKTDSGIIFLSVLIIFTIFSLIMHHNKNGTLNYDDYTISLININFLTLFFWIIRLQTRVAERPSYYFLFFSCALYATVINNIQNEKEKNIYKIFICTFSLILFIYRLKTNFASLIPYQFYQGIM